MADATHAKPASAAAPPPGAELDARVTALLDEMQQASDRMIRHLDGTDPVRPAVPNAPTPPSGPMPPDDLGRAVDQMIADAKTAGRPSGAIAALDQELAHRADDVIEGEIAEETAVLPQGPEEFNANAAPAASAPPPPPRAPAAMAPAPAPPAPAVAAPASPAQLATDSSEPAIVVDEPEREPGYRATVAASALTVFAAASEPLSRRPHLRPWVGYLALWTLFNAVCLLGYNFLVREPVTPRPPVPKAHTAETRPDSVPRGGAADSKSDEHGAASKPDAARTAKATPKARTRSALPKQESRGGGH